MLKLSRKDLIKWFSDSFCHCIWVLMEVSESFISVNFFTREVDVSCFPFKFNNVISWMHSNGYYLLSMTHVKKPVATSYHRQCTEQISQLTNEGNRVISYHNGFHVVQRGLGNDALLWQFPCAPSFLCVSDFHFSILFLLINSIIFLFLKPMNFRFFFWEICIQI